MSTNPLDETVHEVKSFKQAKLQFDPTLCNAFDDDFDEDEDEGISEGPEAWALTKLKNLEEHGLVEFVDLEDSDGWRNRKDTAVVLIPTGPKSGDTLWHLMQLRPDEFDRVKHSAGYIYRFWWD